MSNLSLTKALLEPEIKTIEVNDETYSYYVGNQFVSVERKSIIQPGKTVFTCYMPNRAVGKAIANAEKNCRFRENIAEGQCFRYVDVLSAR